MKIAIAQLNYHIGNFDANFNKMKDAALSAKNAGADLVLFGELAVCGYPPRDFLEFDDFIVRCKTVIDSLANLTTDDFAIVVGAPSVNPVVEGKDLYNSAYFLVEGKIKNVTHKTLLPTYDVFDEYRYFEPNTNFEIVEWKGSRIAVTICEDIWNLNNENPLYKINPMDKLIKQEPDFILNLSASPFNANHAEARKGIVRENARQFKIPLFYANHVGAQTELIFDGGSLVANSQGEIVAELPYFEECIEMIDSDEVNQLVKLENDDTPIARIHDALVLGVKDYFEKLGFQKATLGLSGGVDSALVLYLAVKALGKENVMSVLLPSQYSSDHSISDAEELCHNLGSPFKTISIEDGYFAIENTVKPHFENLPPNVAEENIQARLRGVILMALSNKLGYILLNTSNKSEAAVGYGTLYGDMCGGLAVIGDLYKIQVYELCRYINRNGVVIPQHILDKAPSAELRPGQKDSDSLPDYAILDKVLYEYIENRKGPDEIIAMGYDEALVKRILRMVNMNEWKRHQTAPVLRVTSKSFGMGRRMPIVAKYLG
ncbi:MAG: NAD+ synthase [Chitinophagales bacterium]